MIKLTSTKDLHQHQQNLCFPHFFTDQNSNIVDLETHYNELDTKVAGNAASVSSLTAQDAQLASDVNNVKSDVQGEPLLAIIT